MIGVGKLGELVVTERASVLSEMRPGPVRLSVMQSYSL